MQKPSSNFLLSTTPRASSGVSNGTSGTGRATNASRTGETATVKPGSTGPSRMLSGLTDSAMQMQMGALPRMTAALSAIVHDGRLFAGASRAAALGQLAGGGGGKEHGGADARAPRAQAHADVDGGTPSVEDLDAHGDNSISFVAGRI